MQKKWKKVMAGTLSVCMLATSGPVVSEFGGFLQTSQVAQAATKNLSGKCGTKATWKYNKNTKTLTISGTGEMKNDYSPWKTELGSYQVKKIVIGDGITNIGEEAFSDMGVQEVKIGKKVKRINWGAFENCSSLKKVNFGKNVIEIGTDAFSGCKALETVKFGDNLKKIGYWAFEGCTKLKSVYIGKSLEDIGVEAFDGCNAIATIKVHKNNKYFVLDKNILLNKKKTKIYFGNFTKNTTCCIGSKVEDIDDAIVYAPQIEQFEVNANNKLFSSEDGLLYSKDGGDLLVCPKGKKGTVVVRDDTTGVGVDSIFYSYARYPFKYCSKLEKIVIGKKAENIYCYFSGCDNLKEIEIDAENQTYCAENGSIYTKDKKTLLCLVVPGCDGAYVMPGDEVEIDEENGEDAFSGSAQEIKKILLSEKRKKKLKLPSSVTEITLGKNYYSEEEDLSRIRCGQTKRIYAAEENPYYSSVEGVLYNKEQTKLMLVPECTKVYHMPNTVTGVAVDAIAEEENDEVALEELYVSDYITDMTGWFKGINLKKLHIGKSVKKIDPVITYGLQTITVSSENQNYKMVDEMLYTKDGSKLIWCPQGTKGKVTINKGTSVIGKKAFLGAYDITQISIPATVTTIEEDAFEDLDLIEGSLTILVPKGKKEFYQSLLTKETGFSSYTMTIKENK